MHRRVGGGDPHAAPGAGVHRPDVHLVPVPARRGRPVVADRHRQEVEHQVRVPDLVVAPGEPAALEVVGRPGPAAAKQPPRAHRGPVAPLQRRRHRDRLLARVLDIDLQVVLQVLAHPRQVGHHVDAEPGQQRRAAHPGQLQQLRRVDGPAAQDHLAAPRFPRGTAMAIPHPGRPLTVKEDLCYEGAACRGQVAPPHGWTQIRPCRRQPPAPVDVPVEGRETLLPVPVHVTGQRVPGFLHGREECLEQRAAGRPALQDQRPVRPAELIAPGQAGLHLLEVRQAVRVVPVRHAGIGGPPLIVQRVPALEDHAVDAARPAQHLAPGMVDPPPVHERLRLGLIPPVVEPAPDREGQRRGHMDEDVPGVVRPPGLEHQHPVGRIGRQPAGQRTARRSAADDDEVVLSRGHRSHLLPLVTRA